MNCFYCQNYFESTDGNCLLFSHNSVHICTNYEHYSYPHISSLCGTNGESVLFFEPDGAFCSCIIPKTDSVYCFKVLPGNFKIFEYF